MLDVRPTAYVTPIAEQEIAALTPVIRVQNFADEDAVVDGRVRIYRASTGLLLYTSVLATTQIKAGITTNMSALTPWNPGAPAAADYFIIVETSARSLVPPFWHFCAGNLGAFTFDITAPPMGPVPAGHHTTHETGGMDEVDCTGLVGAGGVPAAHAATHELGGGDDINVAGLSGELADDQPPKAHGNAAHSSTFEDQANKGAAGGYCALPNPLDLTLPLRADGTPARPGTYFQSQDFTRDSLAVGYFVPPWSLNAITSGTCGPVAAEANHPGIIFLKSAAGANSGMNIPLDPLAFLLAGGCRADFYIRPQVLAGAIIRCGFGDVKTAADHVDGIYFEMNTVVAVPGTLVGKSASNSVRTTTATSTVLITNTWYRLHLELNAAANLATFKLYSEAGALLWTDTVNANIPTGAGRQTGHGLTAYNTAGGTVVICDLDYMEVEIRRTLIR